MDSRVPEGRSAPERFNRGMMDLSGISSGWGESSTLNHGDHVPARSPWLAAATLTFALTLVVWSYLPTLRSAFRNWVAIDDYSHGFLVVPISAGILFLRRGPVRGLFLRPDWWGMSLVLLSVLGRLIAAVGHFVWLDGWTLSLFIAGMVWLWGGRSLLLWSWPAILFLVFMFPLPWRVEELLGGTLQRVAARGAAWLLVSLGQPALAEGSTIFLAEDRLTVADACAGLRMFYGITALVTAYLFVSGRPWWQCSLILAAAIPAAVAANVARIAATGLAYSMTSDELTRQWWHDFAGWLMIPGSALLILGFVAWLDRAVCRADRATPADFTRESSWSPIASSSSS